MRLAFWIALRYIFSKKSTNAIHLISAISVFGIGLGSMALLVIMSVFNGFEELLQSLMNSFKPELLVSPIAGKVFSPEEEQILRLQDHPDILALSQTLEEIALFEYEGRQNLGSLKGVDPSFWEVLSLDTCIERGKRPLPKDFADDSQPVGLLGATLEHTLGVRALQDRPVKIFMPKRELKKYTATTGEPFRKRNFYPGAIYAVRQIDYDNMAILPLAFVQDVLAYKAGEISALELRLRPGANEQSVQAAVQEIMGPNFKVQNRYQQDEAFYKITNMEKWVGFLIFAFTLLLVAFNMVGALWMLVLEKKADIAHLQAMGAQKSLLRNIFLAEGFLLSAFGLVGGCLMAILLCVLQQEFGLVALEGAGSNFVVQSYPVSMRLSDFLIVIITVVTIGTGAAYLPALLASRISSGPNQTD